MIIEHKIMSKKMKSMISILELMQKVTKKTMFHFANKKKQLFFLPKQKVYYSNDVNYSIKRKMHVIEFTSKLISNDKHIIYLHGGAFLHKGQHNHYSFLNDLNKELKGKITYIDYPLAPKYEYKSVIKITKDIVSDIMKENNEDQFIIMGDSSGGNLALEVAKALSLRKNKIIVFSPWMDLSMENPDIDKMEHQEFMYTKDELKSAGYKYSGDIPENNEFVSPLFGDYSAFDITVHAGTRDTLYPDILLFEKKNPNVKLHIYHDLPHVFPVFPGTDERKQVIKHIISEIT